MDYQQILLTILTFNFLLYVGAVWAKFGVQQSISMSYYSWSGNWGILFTLFCWILTFTILPVQPNAFFFLTAAGIGFVGAAAQIKKDFVAKVHMPAAIIGITSGMLGIGFTHGDWWLFGIGVTGMLALVLGKVKNHIWWVEIVAFLTIIFSFLKKFF